MERSESQLRPNLSRSGSQRRLKSQTKDKKLFILTVFKISRASLSSNLFTSRRSLSNSNLQLLTVTNPRTHDWQHQMFYLVTLKRSLRNYLKILEEIGWPQRRDRLKFKLANSMWESMKGNKHLQNLPMDRTHLNQKFGRTHFLKLTHTSIVKSPRRHQSTREATSSRKSWSWTKKVKYFQII